MIGFRYIFATVGGKNTTQSLLIVSARVRAAVISAVALGVPSASFVHPFVWFSFGARQCRNAGEMITLVAIGAVERRQRRLRPPWLRRAPAIGARV